ncbi:MAG: 3-carboxy-cis,cis-muconate cycloisomerase [Candidatus Sulfotelmatobacter sp.]
MSVTLVDSLATTEALAELFSDNSVLQAMVEFEIALARVEARIGIIPQRAADAVSSAAAAAAGGFDLPQLSRDSLRAGTPTIPFVKALTRLVSAKDEEAAGFVHWGATSQDVSDTALVLLLKRAQSLLDADLSRAERALQALSEKHKHVLMPARTLLQPAPPITFGLKVAGWFGAICRGRERLNNGFSEALALQFGGAAGTLSALGNQGCAVAEGLAAELGLTSPAAPWHTHRDRLAALMCDCGVITGSIGKIARDISLLMQHEVGEAFEPKSEGRGGSSTMPHKQNPIGCAVCLAAANRIPGLVASYLTSMPQEHERGVGGIQSEWPTIAAIVQATGLAASSIAEIAEGLTIDAGRMRENLDATRGTIFAEKAMILLGAKIGRDKAHRLLEEATRQAITQGRHLADVVAETPAIAQHLDEAALRGIFVAEDYLGSAETFRQRLLASARPVAAKD